LDPKHAYEVGLAAFRADDFRTAVYHLLPLAIQGDMNAQHLMAEAYRWGNGVEQNPIESLRLYKEAADQGHAQAAFDLYFLLLPEATAAPAQMQALAKDRSASQKYLDLALDRFRKLADRGEVEAMMNLGFLFHLGLGVGMDGSEAIRWYSKAFEAGNLGAANGLCLVYYEGDPRVRDKAKALYWYTKAKDFNCRCVEISEFETDAATD